MSNPADGSSGNDLSGSAAGNASGSSSMNTADLERMVNDLVSKAVGARLKRANVEDQVSKAVEAALEKYAAAATVDQKAPGDHASEPEKLNLKAMDEKYKALVQRLEKSEAARQEAESRAKDARYRGEVQAKLAAKLGADNPLVGTLMDSLYDVKKRFVEHPAGGLGVKFKDTYGGDDEIRTLDEGIAALFDTEYKHLITPPSKAPGLPPNGYRQAAGNPYQQPKAPGNGPRVNPLMATIAEAVRDHRPEVAEQLITAHMLPEKK